MTPRRLTTYALGITAAALPAYNVRFRIGPIPTTLLEILILVTVATYGWMLASEHRRPATRTPYDIPIVLLLAAGIIAIVVAPDRVRALGIYRAYFIEAIAIYYVAVDLVRTRAQLRIVLLIAATGSCIFALGQIAAFAIVFAHHAIQIDDPPAFLNTSSNQAAMYLEPPLAFATGFALYPGTDRQRWIALGVTGLILAALVLTLSRAAYLAMTVLAVVAVLSLPSWRLRLWAVAGLVIVLGLILELPFIGTRFSTFGHSVVLRQSIYTEALRMLAKRPIFGAGISGFPIRVAPFRPSGEEIELYPHNLWLTTWSELGLLGLAAFAVIFFGLIWRGARALLRRQDIHRALAWGATGALLLYLVHGMFDSPYWKNDLAVEFWLIAALQVIAIRGAGGPARRQPASGRTTLIPGQPPSGVEPR